MATKGKALGKGLSALLSSEQIPGNEARTVLELNINDIAPHGDQPRKQFHDASLQELAESIKENGVIQPIIVTKTGVNTYTLVAGERRWRASRLAGLKTIPAIVKELTAKETLVQALVENIQREDLNVMEEAVALNRIMVDYSLTQERLAAMVGKSRSEVANIMRLLQLGEAVQDLLRSGEITYGHARSLLAVHDELKQTELAEEIVRQNLSVREAEQAVKDYLNPPVKPKAPTIKHKDANIRSLEEKLYSRLGTKVHIQDKSGKGSIKIDYYSLDELDRILEVLL